MTCALCGRPLGIIAGGMARPATTDDSGQNVCSNTTACKRTRIIASPSERTR